MRGRGRDLPRRGPPWLRDLGEGAALVVGAAIVSVALWHACDRYALAMYGGFDEPFDPRSFQALRPWGPLVLGWALVCWLTSRPRAGGRTRRLPATVAAFVVVARAGACLASADAMWVLWPGPSAPLDWTTDVDHMSIDPLNPAIAWPLVVVAVLVGASWLGVRSGRRHGTAPLRRTGTAGLGVSVVVTTLLVGVGLAVVAFSWWHDKGTTGLTDTDRVLYLTSELGFSLLAAVAAAVLLSGAGRLTGGLVGALAVVLALPYLSTAWGEFRLTALGVGLGVLWAIGAALLWRPLALAIDASLGDDPPVAVVTTAEGDGAARAGARARRDEGEGPGRPRST